MKTLYFLFAFLILCLSFSWQGCQPDELSKELTQDASTIVPRELHHFEQNTERMSEKQNNESSKRKDSLPVHENPQEQEPHKPDFSQRIVFVHKEKSKDGIFGVSDDGKLFRYDSATGQWKYLLTLYSPDSFKKQYLVDAKTGKISRFLGNGRYLLLKQTLNEGFEGGLAFIDLFYPTGIWTGFTLFSPMAKTDAETNKLAKCILKKTCDFRDNRLELSSIQAHSGKSSMRFYAVQKAPDMATSKASMHSSLVAFQKGEHVWFSAWYYIEKEYPYTLVDLEASWIYKSPGMRIVLEPSGIIAFQLAKWINIRTYRQNRNKAFRFPKKQWVHLTFHLFLSEDPKKGKAEIWLNGTLLLQTTGVTLPWSKVFYDRIEVGITATDGTETILFVDDIKLSSQPL